VKKGEKNLSQNEVHRTIALIDLEIQSQKTGSPIELAGRLCMSVRMLYFYMDMMTALGAVIRYSNSKLSFEYVHQGHFKDGIRWIKKHPESRVPF